MGNNLFTSGRILRMKKSKAELLLEGWLATLKYLDHHKVQGRILFAGVSLTISLLVLKLCAIELVTVIKAFQ